MFGAGHVRADEKLFIEFLGGPQPRVLDFNVTVWIFFRPHRQARQVDHASREVCDLDRLTHVQHEDVPADCHGAGLQHELRCLGNGHEVTDDVRMRDRDRTATANLLAEQGHDRP